GKSTPRDSLESTFVQTLQRYEFRERLIPLLARRLVAHARIAFADAEAKIKKYRDRVTSLSGEKGELISMRGRGLISDMEFTSERNKLNGQIQVAQASLADLEVGTSFTEKEVAEV